MADRPSPTTDDPRFAAVWRADQPHVLALATRMLRDRSAAEDVVQDAFRRLSHVPLDEVDDVRAWLSVVVRRLCINRLRSAYSRHESLAPGGSDDLGTDVD